MNVILPIVGAHFRPPAKAIIAALPMGCPLTLVPEPSNPYDPNAIAVFVETGQIKSLSEEAKANLLGLAAGMGHDWESLISPEAWHLGYIPKINAADIRMAEETPGTFGLDPAGKPTIEFKDPTP